MDKFEKTLYLDQAMRQSKETAISAVFSMAVAAVSIGGLRLWEDSFKTVGFKETNIVLMYLIGVFLTACVTRGYFWGVLSAVGATFAFNYFFTAPYYSLNVSRSRLYDHLCLYDADLIGHHNPYIQG